MRPLEAVLRTPTSYAPRLALLGSGLALSLACGGLLGDDAVSPDAAAEAAVDETDPAEAARRAGNYQEAERILNKRLSADNTDARSWRLLGDVNFTRGQRYRDRWKENLGWAREKYANALAVDPTNCITWNRMAVALSAAAQNEQIAATPEEIDALPLAEGWDACRGPAMAAIEFAKQATDVQYDEARKQTGYRGTWGEVQAVAAPWQVAAMQRVTNADLEWKDLLVRPEPARGETFVVLDFPVTANGRSGAKSRSFTYPEWISIGSVSGDTFVYLDRRFPMRIPSVGRVKATACPGTSWDNDGPDRAPRGKCVAGQYDRSKSPVYDPAKLRNADSVYYHHPSIGMAEIPFAKIADDSILCSGGKVGRQFEKIPSCQVSYDEAVPQTRAISSSVGLMAMDREHGEKMVRVLRAGNLYGEDIAAQLGRGRVAVGMSYTEFIEAWPTLKGCMGRALHTKSDIIDAGFEMECELGDWVFHFRDLSLIDIRGK